MSVKLQTVSSVTTAVDNTAISLSASQVLTTTLTVQAEATNTESVFVGGSSVTTASGLELEPGDVMEIEGPNTRGITEEFDVQDCYIISTTAGQKVRLAGFQRKP
jgi:hypothetical protein